MEPERKKRSSIWAYFTENGRDKAKCGICAGILSYKGGSTANLIRHLTTKHPELGLQLTRNKKVKPESEDNEDTSASKPSTSLLLPLAPRSKKLQANQALGLLTGVTTTPFITKPVSVMKNNKFDKQLVKMIVKEYHPYSIVENEEFRKLIKMLNPAYSLPTRETISTSLIPKFYNKTSEKIRKCLKKVSAVTITTDGWTSVNGQSYIAMTIHFVDENCELKSCLLDCFEFNAEHTPEDLSSEMKRVLKEWDLLEKIAAVVSDNAVNVVSAIELCGWMHIPCFAHSVSQVIQAGTQEIKELQEKVKMIVEYFKQNPEATANLLASQKQMGFPELKLKQDVATRWNSTYDMFRRFLELKDPVISTLSLINPELNQLTESDWVVLSKTCEVLKVFQEVTMEMSCENTVTISKVILLSKALLHHTSSVGKEKDLPEEIGLMIQEIVEQLSKRFIDVEGNPLFAESTFLDPRFKKQGFQEEQSFKDVYQSLSETASKVQPTSEVTITQVNLEEKSENATAASDLEKLLTSTLSHWEAFDSKISNFVNSTNPTTAGIIELDKYLQEPLINRNDNPLLWWRERKFIYPRLYEIMKTRLCIVATAVPSESVFSKIGQLKAERRKRLTSGKVSKVMFLNYNMI